MRPLVAALLLAISCGGAARLTPGIDCGTTDERLGSYDSTARDCVWNAYTKGEAVHWALRAYTIEGDPIVYTLAFDPRYELVVTRDTTADRFAGAANQRVSTYRCRTMTKSPQGQDISRYGFLMTNCTGDGTTASVP